MGNKTSQECDSDKEEAGLSNGIRDLFRKGSILSRCSTPKRSNEVDDSTDRRHSVPDTNGDSPSTLIGSPSSSKSEDGIVRLAKVGVKMIIIIIIQFG